MHSCLVFDNAGPVYTIESMQSFEAHLSSSEVTEVLLLWIDRSQWCSSW